MKKPLSVRMAVFSARHRWLVLGLWCFIMVGLTTIGAGIPASSRPYDQFATFGVESTNATRVFNENSPQGEAYEDFFMVINHPTLKASAPPFRATVEQLYRDLASLKYEDKPLFSVLLNP